MPSYSQATDLLLGDIPLGRYIDKEKFIKDAADEIDGMIGSLYQTPIDMTDNGPVSRPARLLLKRISAHLSSGRLIMAMDASGQDEELQKYGIYLVREAEKLIKQIMSGAIELDGAEKIERGDGEATTPLINNLDERSRVEAFYNGVGYNGTGRGIPTRNWQ